ncbi:Hypothetical Protein FCC1311_082222 [Hondaea fermentalgiana]|uniref:Uncharacterized protein n=1 Tax=Hondaea fermentalgiana TaxID=2315210 RepID=A0A2R5GM90_9STRA|nr:Hypothetical Protein FCC1311_082222 [Hondaea fermentalgiana]|eukprot:GBG31997.1 Hypothetical Protein FCC1311_082222 [Hondaea fermentalgiana]
MAKGQMFMGKSPQQVQQDIQNKGAPKGKSMAGFGGVRNEISKKGGDRPDIHQNHGGMANMVNLDHNPKARDGSHKPSFKTELATAISEKDMGMLHELLTVVTDNEAKDLYEVILNLIKQDQNDRNGAVFESVCDHKLPNFATEHLAELVFFSLKGDLPELAKHFVKQQSSLNKEAFAKALDKCIVKEGLHDSRKGDDPLIEQIDRFIDENMPEVELVYKKHMEDQEMRAKIDA